MQKYQRRGYQIGEVYEKAQPVSPRSHLEAEKEVDSEFRLSRCRVTGKSIVERQ